MQNDITKQLKDTEFFMLAQFIDVMDLISKYEKIEDVREDVKKRKNMYLENIKKLSSSTEFWDLNLYSSNIDSKIERCKEIYSISNEGNDLHLAYKIGLIDGMKVKNKCT